MSTYKSHIVKFLLNLENAIEDCFYCDDIIRGKSITTSEKLMLKNTREEIIRRIICGLRKMGK